MRTQIRITVLIIMFVWLVEQLQMKEECKYVLTMFGEHFATEKVTVIMLMLIQFVKQLAMIQVGYLLLVVVIIIFPGGEVYLAESPDAGNDVILIADMSCSESATSISQCSLTYYTKVSSCDAKHTAAVRCHSTFYIIFELK